MASAAMAANKYTFEDSSPSYEFKLSSNSHRRGRKNSYDEENGSLTYSATSSINSKESTDSSFAEIRRALEAGGGDSKELAAYLKHRHHQQQHQHQRDSLSVAGDSLAYSTDAESHLRFGGDSLAYSADSYTRSMATGADSHLQGSDFVSGHGSTQHHGTSESKYDSHLGASYLNNGGGQRFEPDEEEMALMFAPAEHAEGMKRRKERKRRERLWNRTNKKKNESKSSTTATDTDEVNVSMTSSTATPKASGSSSSSPRYRQQQQQQQSVFVLPRDTEAPQRISPYRESRQGTPPSARPPMPTPSPPRKKHSMEHPEGDNDEDDDADVWYGKWWMFCFPDLIKTMSSQVR